MNQDAISIFGGTGFVGSEFVRQSRRPCWVIPRESRKPQCRDILYLISTTSNYNVFEDLHLDVQVNVEILLQLLEQVKGNDHIVNFVSSWFVYGDTELPAHEESACRPKGFYSITKLCAEQLLVSFCETFDIPYRIFRLCNVYGLGDKGASSKKNALQHLINQIRQNEPIKLYHDGHFYRDYMHVIDVARALHLGLERAPLNSITNIGSGEKILFRKLIDLAIKYTGSTSKIETMEPPRFHKTVQVKDFYMRTDKLKGLGFKPEVSIEEGIRTLCLV